MGQRTLPELDRSLPAAGAGGPFSADHRWFDFRNAAIPWDEYKGLAANEGVCRPHTKDAPIWQAFGYEREYHNGEQEGDW